MSIFDTFKKLEEQRSARTSGKIEWIIAGLGNPGMTYEQTRHNAGFIAVSHLAKQCNISLQTMRFHADCGDGMVNGTRCLLMKPTTYMNNSGEAVAAAANFYKIPADHVLVLYDDITLAPGKLRVRKKGSAGGHNGMKSIIALLGTEDFPRLRIGVGAKPHPDYNLADWVLSKFTEDEMTALSNALPRCVEGIGHILKGEFDKAMNLCNTNA